MIEIQLISALLGLVIGLILALTGAGGSLLAIPLLIFGLDISLTQAAPIALLAVMSAASVGAAQGLRDGIVRYKTALLIASFGMAIAPLGVWLAKRSPILMLNLIFAAVLAFVAWRMWLQSTQMLQESEDKSAPVCLINPATSKLFWTALCTRRLVITGGLTGLLSGLLGVGGGFVIVPSLRKVSNFDMQTIVATSLAAIALVSAVSVFTYFLQGDINWAIATPFVISTIVGMLVFRLFSDKISAKFSQRSFAILAVTAALMMTAKGLAVF